MRTSKNTQKKKHLKKFLYIALIIIIVGILAYNAYLVTDWFTDKKENQEELSEIEQEVHMQETAEGENVNPPENKSDDYWDYIKMPLIDVDIAELQKINSDTIGFLSVSRNKYKLSCCTNHK